MHTRKLHALMACALFLLAAIVYGGLTGKPMELWRVAFWSMVGIASYIALSRVFGFDPHRTRVARYASPLGVHDFRKRTSLIEYDAAAAAAHADAIAALAACEGLEGHGRSARMRGGAS